MKKPLQAELKLNRRAMLALLGAGGLATGTPALADDALALGLIPDSTVDQTNLLQMAMDRFAASGQMLTLPSGTFYAQGLRVPTGLRLGGAGERTVLKLSGAQTLLIAEDIATAHISDIHLEGDGRAVDLAAFKRVADLTCTRVSFANANGNGLFVEGCAGRVRDCNFSGFGLSGLHGQDSAGLLIEGNHIEKCGNGGIRIWRYAQGFDGTIVSNNRIETIESSSGNGQNGNGVNAFQADGVVISGNVISNCAFSAIRLNGTNNCVVSGNICTDSREVAIFSEFAFTGSIISDNIVDQAAQGISIANFDHGGRLAICSNNIVRNIWPSSPTNPDTVPVGIFAEADTAISGNVVENVPGTGIAAGWGPFLRDVLVSGNIVRDTDFGIGVSVAEGAGRTKVSNNLITGSRKADLAGFAWSDVISGDLTQDADKFPHIDLS